MRGQNLYVQGFYVPALATYYYFNDAAFNAYPSTSANPVNSVALPFDGSYMGMARTSNETMQSPHFSSYWIHYNADILGDPNATATARAGALMFFVEAIAEGSRFKAISDDIYNDLQTTNVYYGYQFTSDDVGLVTNWAAIGNNFQQRLNNQNTPPYPAIGNYNFATLASTAAILALVLKFSNT